MSNDEYNETKSGKIVHLIELRDWYATQYGRSVEIYAQGSDRPSQVVRPPRRWGDDWKWNVCEDGIYFCRTEHHLDERHETP